MANIWGSLVRRIELAEAILPPRHLRSTTGSQPYLQRCLSTTTDVPLRHQTEDPISPGKKIIDEDTIQSAKAEATMQRFWKTVDIHPFEGQYCVRLDQRKLVTPAGNPLVIPQSRFPLAILVAREWSEQRKILKQHSLPLTSLVSRAIDGLNETDRSAIVDSLVQYLDTDTVCFLESKPQRLVDLQELHWKPLIQWVKQAYSIDLKVHVDSILFAKQSQQAKDCLRSVVMQFDRLKLAGFERAVHVTKSFVISLALVEGRITVEEASKASRVEVLSQIARWGEVEDTHDVDHEEIRMKLGSVACSLIESNPIPSA